MSEVEQLFLDVVISLGHLTSSDESGTWCLVSGVVARDLLVDALDDVHHLAWYLNETAPDEFTFKAPIPQIP